MEKVILDLAINLCPDSACLFTKVLKWVMVNDFGELHRYFGH